MDQELLDEIYEAAFLPELWPSVLERLARMTDARGGQLYAISDGPLRWAASRGLHESVATRMNADLLKQSQRMARMQQARHCGFVTEADLYTDEELNADPFYRDLLWNCGLGWGAGTLVTLPTGEMIVLSVERNRARGPVEPTFVRQLDVLRPHLARSATMSARLRMERARAVSETLALIGLPALVFDDRGKVLAANPPIEAMNEHIRWGARDRIALSDAKADKLFQDAVGSLGFERPASVRSFAVRDAVDTAAMVAHVVPIRGDARDIFSRCTGVLVLTSVTAPQAPPVELIQSLFDLSPAEARVARRLAEGKTLDEIASQGGVSGHTVRTQMKEVLGKTGCHRQAEVVALLGGISIPRG